MPMQDLPLMDRLQRGNRKVEAPVSKHGPMLEKVIIYKSDDTGMWWAELQEPVTGKWRHICQLTHAEAIAAVGDLIQGALEGSLWKEERA